MSISISFVRQLLSRWRGDVSIEFNVASGNVVFENIGGYLSPKLPSGVVAEKRNRQVSIGASWYLQTPPKSQGGPPSLKEYKCQLEFLYDKQSNLLDKSPYPVFDDPPLVVADYPLQGFEIIVTRISRSGCHLLFLVDSGFESQRSMNYKIFVKGRLYPRTWKEKITRKIDALLVGFGTVVLTCAVAKSIFGIELLEILWTGILALRSFTFHTAP